MSHVIFEQNQSLNKFTKIFSKRVQPSNQLEGGWFEIFGLST